MAAPGLRGLTIFFKSTTTDTMAPRRSARLSARQLPIRTTKPALPADTGDLNYLRFHENIKACRKQLRKIDTEWLHLSPKERAYARRQAEVHLEDNLQGIWHAECCDYQPAFSLRLWQPGQPVPSRLPESLLDELDHEPQDAEGNPRAPHVPRVPLTPVPTEAQPRFSWRDATPLNE